MAKVDWIISLWKITQHLCASAYNRENCIYTHCISSPISVTHERRWIGIKHRLVVVGDAGNLLVPNFHLFYRILIILDKMLPELFCQLQLVAHFQSGGNILLSHLQPICKFDVHKRCSWQQWHMCWFRTLISQISLTSFIASLRLQPWNAHSCFFQRVFLCTYSESRQGMQLFYKHACFQQ